MIERSRDFEEVLLQEGPEFLRWEAGQFPDFDTYQAELNGRYAFTELGHMAEKASRAVANTHDETSNEPDPDVQRAFYTGELIGLSVAKHFLPTFADEMIEVPLDFKNLPVDENDPNLIGKVILKFAEIGDANTRSFTALLEDWEDETDFGFHPYMRYGFGFVMVLMDSARKQRLTMDRHEFAKEAKNFDDWDGVLKQILSEGVNLNEDGPIT